MSRGQGAGTERWYSGWGAILAVAGSAVGLGNLVRFPGQVMANFAHRTSTRVPSESVSGG